MYDADVSASLVPRVTDAVIDQVTEWQARPLDDVYPIAYLDCIVVKIRQDKRVINKAVYLALGVKHQPRLDVSGTDLVTMMDSMDEATIAAMQETFAETRVRPNGVSPNFFALPQLVEREPSGAASGACFIPSPHARVSAAD
jgi:hypothetical protein